MALTTARTGLTPQQWDDTFFMEYVRENRFKRYMGTDENSIIHTKENLTKARGAPRGGMDHVCAFAGELWR